jgi:predicted transcriptional regulator
VPEERVLLLSVRPRFARAILAGTKTVEVRRRRVQARPGTRVIIYASNPTMAVVGTARLLVALTYDPDAAWASHERGLGLHRHEFDAYLAGSKACLLLLDEVTSLDTPISLDELRRSGDFRPPQSYRYLSPSDPEQVLVLGRPESLGGG